MIVTVRDDADLKKLENFLSAIVVNKSLFWSLHIKTNLDRLRALGLTYWVQSQRIPLSRAWAKKKAKLNGHQNEANVATGQTKEQALFLTGTGEIYKEKNSIHSSVIAANWIPNAAKGSPPWRGLDSDRPFYTVSMIRHRMFWRPDDGYVDLRNSNKEIWNKKTAEEIPIDTAMQYLIMNANDSEHILKGRTKSLGSWHQGSNSGVAANWR